MTKIQVNRQAENEQGATDAPEAGGSKRKQVSKRSFLLASGQEAERIEEAAGARYTLLAPSGNKDFDVQFGEPGKLVTMCAIFGFHTKIGNVANTVLNDKDEPGSPDDAASEIEAFITKAQAGTWAERSEGPVGSRIDKDALAGSIMSVAEAAAGGPGLAKRKDGQPLTYDFIRERLENEPQYVRAARTVPAVATEYATRVGKANKSIDDLLG